MFKIITPFYIICFALYIFFTRQPDYLDGQFSNGIIHYVKDSNRQTIANAFFIVDKTSFKAKAFYPLRSLKENESVQIIYDTTNPAHAAVYKWWGYWIRWDEILASLFLIVLLYYGASAITSNPTPENLNGELENKRFAKRKKYN